jgi:GR25 family glycosyltransferase involved in LPS biosynthesis
MKTYIINVSTNEPRRNHILNVISQNPCLRDYSFMHDGDLETISKEILTKYFGGKLNSLKPAVSCTYKHMLVYFELLKLKRSEYALILEDDIYLNDNFCEKLKNILNEIKKNRKLYYFIRRKQS